VLARFILDKNEPKKITQVYRRDDAGLAVSAAFRKALPSDVDLEDRMINGAVDEAFWRNVSAEKPGALVLWLNANDLKGLPALSGSTEIPVYLSSGLLGGKVPQGGVQSGANVRLIYPSDLSPKHESRMLRTKIWLHNKGIPIVDEGVQINTLFALTVASDALGHIMDSFSRDYFIERIEHAVAQTPTPSLFQNVSLGPGQRFAAKGSTVVQWMDGEKGKMSPLSGWIVP
jgi:hypothetical protein